MLMAELQKNVDKQRRDKRDRLSELRVLLADRDSRTATLVHRILFSFGFRQIDAVTNGDLALKLLRSKHYDLIITELSMQPTDGVRLVREIRTAREDKRIRRDIPIIMLTAQGERDNVEVARDAGINEFVLKPFSAKTISERIIALIDNPRAFIEVDGYVGPCRRRREKLAEGVQDRRVRISAQKPPNEALREQLAPALEIFTDQVISEAQVELLKAEAQYIGWARADISKLETAYTELKARPGSKEAQQKLLDAAYAIKSQAGIFGYDLGTGVASLLVNYLIEHENIQGDRLIVVRKHIDAIAVIFTQQIKETGQKISQELINSLRKLVQKLG